jgi:predicted DsbA family dithiol-disulfide isomerase
MPTLTITEFGDPACPFGWSSSPARRRLMWLFGDEIEWRLLMVGLSENPDDAAKKGFTPAMAAAGARRLSELHGMPIDTSERPRMAASIPACRAVVAVRLNQPGREHAMFRRLQMRQFAGALLDDPETIAAAALDLGIDPQELAQWSESSETEQALQEDLRQARNPTPEALALAERLAQWSGGLRYTCPSYEIVRNRDGARISVPGFQPLRAYEVAIANLAPELARRDDPEGVEEVLEWAGEPLATAEVAEVLGGSELNDARQLLGRVASEQHVGFDGFWTLGAAEEQPGSLAATAMAVSAGH